MHGILAEVDGTHKNHQVAVLLRIQLSDERVHLPQIHAHRGGICVGVCGHSRLKTIDSIRSRVLVSTTQVTKLIFHYLIIRIMITLTDAPLSSV